MATYSEYLAAICGACSMAPESIGEPKVINYSSGGHDYIITHDGLSVVTFTRDGVLLTEVVFAALSPSEQVTIKTEMGTFLGAGGSPEQDWSP